MVSSNYAINATLEQSLRSNRAVLPALVIAALDHSMSIWAPITREELDALITKALLQSSHEAKRCYSLISMPPTKWALSPWGDEGGGFWVIAVFGCRALWYNDIEDGFNVSSYSAWGVLDSYACDQLELQHCLHRFSAHILSGDPFPGESFGPPRAVI